MARSCCDGKVLPTPRELGFLLKNVLSKMPQPENNKDWVKLHKKPDAQTGKLKPCLKDIWNNFDLLHAVIYAIDWKTPRRSLLACGFVWAANLYANEGRHTHSAMYVCNVEVCGFSITEIYKMDCLQDSCYTSALAAVMCVKQCVLYSVLT